jgi:hypothetical protein
VCTGIGLQADKGILSHPMCVNDVYSTGIQIETLTVTGLSILETVSRGKFGGLNFIMSSKLATSQPNQDAPIQSKASHCSRSISLLQEFGNPFRLGTISLDLSDSVGKLKSIHA